MTKPNDVDKVFETTVGQAAFTAISAGVGTELAQLAAHNSALAGTDTLGVALLAAVVMPYLNKRPLRFFKNLQERLTAAEIRLDELSTDRQELVAVVALQAAQDALTARDGEKLAALQNAVFNTAIGINIDEQTQLILLGIIRQLSETHIRTLKFLADPMAYPEPPRPPDHQLTLQLGFEWAISAALPEMDFGTSLLYRPVMTDLYNKDLTTVNILSAGIDHTTLSMSFNHRSVPSLLTPLGAELMNYISEWKPEPGR